MKARNMLVAAMTLVALVPLQAQAGCKEKLAEVDRRMANPQIPEQQRGALEMFRDQAASCCSQGHEPTAMQTLAIMEIMSPPSEARRGLTSVSGIGPRRNIVWF